MDPIRRALEDLRLACETERSAAVARADLRFHEALLLAAGDEEFMPMWRWLCSQMLLTYSRLDNYQQVCDEHQDIFQALKSGKRQAVVAAIKANIR